MRHFKQSLVHFFYLSKMNYPWESLFDTMELELQKFFITVFGGKEEIESFKKKKDLLEQIKKLGLNSFPCQMNFFC